MKINDFDANVYFLELKKVKEQEGIEFGTWYLFDRLQKKFSKTFESVQGLIEKILKDTPGITNEELKIKLLQSIGDSSQEYKIEKIPHGLLRGLKGNWSVLSELIDLPKEEDSKPGKKK